MYGWGRYPASRAQVSIRYEINKSDHRKLESMKNKKNGRG